jgi:phospholipid transport system substrate-binding protein
MSNTLNRRSFVALTGAALLSVTPAVALDTAGAQTLIANVVSDINKVINSGKSERQMFGDFERIFKKYGDVPIIARSTLGADARRATPAQLKAFSNAFGSYLARKYGKRFREFIGGKIEVKSARAVKSYFEVATTAKLQRCRPTPARSAPAQRRRRCCGG